MFKRILTALGLFFGLLLGFMCLGFSILYFFTDALDSLKP